MVENVRSRRSHVHLSLIEQTVFGELYAALSRRIIGQRVVHVTTLNGSWVFTRAKIEPQGVIVWRPVDIVLLSNSRRLEHRRATIHRGFVGIGGLHLGRNTLPTPCSVCDLVALLLNHVVCSTLIHHGLYLREVRAISCDVVYTLDQAILLHMRFFSHHVWRHLHFSSACLYLTVVIRAGNILQNRVALVSDHLGRLYRKLTIVSSI